MNILSQVWWSAFVAMVACYCCHGDRCPAHWAKSPRLPLWCRYGGHIMSVTMTTSTLPPSHHVSSVHPANPLVQGALISNPDLHQILISVSCILLHQEIHTGIITAFYFKSEFVSTKSDLILYIFAFRAKLVFAKVFSPPPRHHLPDCVIQATHKPSGSPYLCHAPS